MARPLKIISIDGTKGSGKTSQIGMLARLFKTSDIPCLVVGAGKDAASGQLSIQKIRTFIAENPNGIAILDGSIARMMVADLMIGKQKEAVIDEYKHLTHAYERLDHEFGIAAFLMIMDDLGEGERRLVKRKALLGIDTENYDPAYEADIVNGMRFFNNHVASKNMTFRIIEINNDDTMMDVNRNLMKSLNNNYDMPSLKKDKNEW